MHAILARRSCTSALRGASRRNGSRRAFSSSCAHQRGSLPQFLPASTPELSTLLHTLNSRVLLPEHLTPDQKKLVFRKENKAKLEAEPIEITLGNVTLALEHLDKLRDLPKRWSTIHSIIGKSSTPEDYENLVRMIEGLRSAGILLPQQRQEKVVRVLSEAGQQHLVLKLFQRARATDMRLRSPGLVAKAFEGLLLRAERSGWDEAETKKMLGFAEQYVELMDDKEHHGKSEMGPDDLRGSPVVIRYPLALAAVRAKQHTGGQDVDGKVRLYAGRLMEALRQRNYLVTGLPDEVSQKTLLEGSESDKNNLRDYYFNIRRLMWLWVALHVSRDVLGPNMPHPQDAEKIESVVWSEWKMAKRIIDDRAPDQLKTHAQKVEDGLKEL